MLGDVAEKPVPVKAEKPAVKPSPATKSEPVAKAAQPAKAAPWADGNPKMLKQYPTRLPEPLHMKLAWLAEHVPASSIQKIIVAGAEKEVERLLKEYYK